ncbi:DUF7115 domain-containing protein [Halorarum salinum]|uniref:DUF7115 domain-containing protein n=1 Tax=Halorarum salinum TaxID=2743089 RepID=A0A7D5QCJ1_9EURY|nr:hypothetical protein [Halobaculum salinum]QLG61561.1 hypothetical protein HUG12_07400 [Halobaculum salinum]
MSLPELVQREMGGEDPAARVHLGGDDELFVTPTRTLIYRGEGLLSDESVEEYPHDAERIAVSESRRKAKLTLDYGLDGERSFAVPRKRFDGVLHPVIAGVLSAADITDPGETVERTFRFSDLTLVVTSARVVKHIGAAVWDEEYEEFPFDDVTDLTFEEGSVATSVVLSVNGRQERFKAPAEEARAVRESLTEVITAYYGVDSLEAFRALSADAEGEDEEDRGEVDFGDGPDPLSAEPAEVESPENATREDPLEDVLGDDAGAEPAATTAGGGESASGGQANGGSAAAATEPRADEDAFEETGFEVAEPTDDAAEEFAALRQQVEAQNERLDRQRELIERLIEELRRGR